MRGRPARPQAVQHRYSLEEPLNRHVSAQVKKARSGPEVRGGAKAPLAQGRPLQGKGQVERRSSGFRPCWWHRGPEQQALCVVVWAPGGVPAVKGVGEPPVWRQGAQVCVGLCQPSWPESKTSGEVQPDGVTNRGRGKQRGDSRERLKTNTQSNIPVIDLVQKFPVFIGAAESLSHEKSFPEPQCVVQWRAGLWLKLEAALIFTPESWMQEPPPHPMILK